MYYADPPAEPSPPPAPGGMPPVPPGGPVPDQGLAPILVAFDPPVPQSRGTVAIRILLAVPHLIVLYALGIAAEVIVIIGWFGALFTGRLPEFAAEFLTNYLRWQTRVHAYVCLLTGVYPPFALAGTDVPYPVRIAARPGRLNRLAVLFRAILLIPAGIVALVLSYGAFTLVLFVSWLIALITGRLPDALHQAFAASLRYYVRLSGYTLMLTSAYPGGLFGDRPPAPAQDPATAFPPVPALAVPDDPWTLVLTSGARKLVGWFLVIGAVVGIGGSVGGAVALSSAAGTVSKAIAFDDLQTAVNPVNKAIQNDAKKAQDCGNNLPCVTRVDRELAGVYSTFADQVAAIHMPSGLPSTYAADVVADTRKLISIYTQLGNATTTQQYLNTAEGTEGSKAEVYLSTLSADFTRLEVTLKGS